MDAEIRELIAEARRVGGLVGGASALGFAPLGKLLAELADALEAAHRPEGGIDDL